MDDHDDVAALVAAALWMQDEVLQKADVDLPLRLEGKMFHVFFIQCDKSRCYAMGTSPNGGTVRIAFSIFSEGGRLVIGIAGVSLLSQPLEA